MTWDTAPVDTLLQVHLRLDEERSTDDWRRWELKTLNIHRGVLHGRIRDARVRGENIGRIVSEQARSFYRVSWWRGFGFGALVEFPAVPGDASALLDRVHTVDSWSYTCQWLIVAFEHEQIVLGIHTWMEVRLSNLYRELLRSFRRQGFEAAHHKKRKSRFLKLLHAVGGRFPEVSEP
jgi:hypothetical protein